MAENLARKTKKMDALVWHASILLRENYPNTADARCRESAAMLNSLSHETAATVHVHYCRHGDNKNKPSKADTPKMFQGGVHVTNEVQERPVVLQGKRLQPKVLRIQGCGEALHA